MNVFDLFATLSLDDSEYTSGLQKAESEASSFSSSVIDKIGGGLATAAKVGAAAIGTATAAVGALTGAAVSSYSTFEQLEGGVNKLYGSAADQIMQYASKAYETAGMSANQYMEQATSFSASLISSVGNDVQEAAKLTDIAMTAMSDNVNVFGSNMSDVQNAFQGFAKQNYTMLDNLKLGYGGTKEEMERLVSEASNMKEAQEELNLTVDEGSLSFDNIIKAIQVVQKEQGIAGTTANEAASTIEGSLTMVKASWENLVSSFANPDANIGELVGTVLDNVGIAANNVIPAVEQSLTAIGEAITTGIPSILDTAGSMIADFAPDLLSAATALVTSLASGIVSAAPQVVDAFSNLLSDAAKAITSFDFSSISSKSVDSFVSGLTKNAGKLLNAGIELIKSVGTGIKNGLPTLLETGLNALVKLSGSFREGAGKLIDAGIELIKNVAQGLINGLPAMIETIPTIVTNIAGIINDNAPKLLKAGVELIGQLAMGIVQAIPTLVANIPEILTAIWNAFMAFNWVALGTNLITFIGNGIKTAATAIPQMLQNIGQTAAEFFTSVNWAGVGDMVITTIIAGIRGLMSLIPTTLTGIAQAGMAAFTAVNWASIGMQAIQAILSGIGSVAGQITTKLRSVAQDGWNAFKSISWVSLGSNIISGIISGISSAGGQIASKLRSLANDALSAAKSALGIQSPSKVFRDEVGKQIALGIADGIKQNADYATKSADEIGQAVIQAAQKRLDNHKVYNDLSLAAEVTYWDEVRKQVDKGTQARIDADKKYYETLAQLEKENYDRQVKSFTSSWMNGMLMSAKEAAEEVAAVVYGDERMQVAQKWLENQKTYFDISEKYELKYWDKIRKTFKKGTQDRVDADKKYFELKQKLREDDEQKEEQHHEKVLSKFVAYIGKRLLSVEDASKKIRSLMDTDERLSAAQKWIDNQKIYFDVSLEYEVKYWNSVRKQFQKGTQDRIDADKKYFDLKESLEEERESRLEAKRDKRLSNYVTKIGKVAESAANAAGKIAQLAARAGENLISEAEKRLANRKVYYDTSIDYEVKYWDTIRGQFKKGTQERIDADEKYFEAVRKQREQQEQEEKDYQEKRVSSHLAAVQQVVTNATEAARNVARLVGDVYENLLSNAEKWLSNYQVYHETTLAYEVEYWDAIRQQYAEGTQERIDADRKYFEAYNTLQEAKQKAYSDARSLTQKYISDYKKLETGLAEDLEKLNEQTTEKLKKIYDKRDSDIAKIDEKLKTNLENNAKNLEKEIQSINDNLDKNIQKLTDDYNKSVESRINSIMGVTKLFERTSFDKTYSKEYLRDALASQVKDLEAWDEELDKLENKLGRDNPLYEQLESMGVSSLYTLKEINGMSEDELNEYSALYKKKTDVATQRALQENERLKKQTESEIAAMRKDAAAQIETAKELAESVRLELISTAETEREEIRLQAELDAQEIKVTAEKTATELKDAAHRQMSELTEQYKTDMDTLAQTCKTKGVEVGKSMADGIKEGIEAMAAELASAAARVAQEALNAAQSVINSSAPIAAENATITNGGSTITISEPVAVRADVSPTSSSSSEKTLKMTAKRVYKDSGITQNITINSPTTLSASEVARQTRNSTQQMMLALSGV